MLCVDHHSHAVDFFYLEPPSVNSSVISVREASRQNRVYAANDKGKGTVHVWGNTVDNKWFGLSDSKLTKIHCTCKAIKIPWLEWQNAKTSLRLLRGPGISNWIKLLKSDSDPLL